MRLAVIALAAFPAFSASVTTAHYDNARTGANKAETALTQATVASNKFQKLWSYSVTGLVFAQPLILENIVAGGFARTICIVATTSNYLYAFDADRGGAAIWTVGPSTFGNPFNDPANVFLIDGNDGILGTPVIDPSTNVIYFTSQNSIGVRRIYAVNAADGSPYHAPAIIAGTAAGKTFDSSVQMQRPALLLLGSKVYVGFGTYGDTGTGYGWVMAFDKTTLAQSGAFMANPGSGSFGAASWSPLSSDGTSIFLTTGSVAACDPGDYSESFIRLTAAVVLADFMTPSDCDAMNMNDRDLGSSRPLVIGNYVVTSGKDGRFWSLNKAAMGSVQGAGPAINQVFTFPWAETNDNCYNGMSYANGVFYISCGFDVDFEKTYAYSFNESTGLLNSTPLAQSSASYFSQAMTYSSNANVTGSQILWVRSTQTSVATAQATGVLRAYNASTLAQIWQSGTYLGDSAGNVAKFCPPVVVNGKVYMATFSGAVYVYGLVAPTAILF